MLQIISRGSFVCLTLCAALFLSQPCTAQSQQAAISGIVSDSSGAALPGARITVTNTATNVTTLGVANEAGAYRVPNLEIGDYTVAVDLEGFRRYQQTKIVLNTAENTPSVTLRWSRYSANHVRTSGGQALNPCRSLRLCAFARDRRSPSGRAPAAHRSAGISPARPPPTNL